MEYTKEREKRSEGRVRPVWLFPREDFALWKAKCENQETLRCSSYGQYLEDWDRGREEAAREGIRVVPYSMGVQQMLDELARRELENCPFNWAYVTLMLTGAVTDHFGLPAHIEDNQVAIWVFPPENFPQWKAAFNPYYQDHQEFMGRVAALQARLEGKGREVRRVHIPVGEMIGELHRRGLSHARSDCGLIAAIRAGLMPDRVICDLGESHERPHQAAGLWIFPERQFDLWREVCKHPDCESYAQFFAVIAATQADEERKRRKVTRMFMTVEQMLEELACRELRNDRIDRAILLGYLVDGR